ncbi:MAG: phosphoglucosamine mutase [Sedimentisphaerales bacterium]|nr:phosphoglucosamine mutase [Sedimentisphaerales bacterium]
MTEPLIISVSGMRGIIGENLTASVAVEYGGAFGTFLKESNPDSRLSVCIGTDSRPSGQMLKSAVTAGLTGAGVDVIDLGLVTTPCVGISLRQLGCAGGVVITASHNPIRYNGIKLLLSNGIAPSPEVTAKIRQIYFDKKIIFADSTDCGKVTCDDMADDRHISKLLAIIDKEKIANRKFKVALDSVNGSGGRVTKKLLAELGCEVFAVNEEPTGLFPHNPEPTAANLADFCRTVKAEGVDIGFAQDPDADRLAIVDENGSYIGEEYTLALAAKYIFSKKTGKAAANLSTSRMIDDIARNAGGSVIRTPVGEANVASAMLDNDCIIGGEGNGGVIDLRVGPIRDSLVGIALVLQLMAETGKSISELAGEIGGYYMSKEKFSANQELARRILDSAKKVFTGAKLDATDGCRFDFDDGWLHIRPSNTEPVMRVIVEAKDRVTAQKYIDAIMKIRGESTE